MAEIRITPEDEAMIEEIVGLLEFASDAPFGSGSREVWETFVAGEKDVIRHDLRMALMGLALSKWAKDAGHSTCWLNKPTHEPDDLLRLFVYDMKNEVDHTKTPEHEAASDHIYSSLGSDGADALTAYLCRLQDRALDALRDRMGVEPGAHTREVSIASA